MDFLSDSDEFIVQETAANELPAKPAKLLRFAAHLGLALADLDIVPPQHITDVPELAEIQVMILEVNLPVALCATRVRIVQRHYCSLLMETLSILCNEAFKQQFLKSRFLDPIMHAKNSYLS